MIKDIDRVTVTWMISEALERVLAIDERCFVNHWVRDDYMMHLRKRNCIGMTARQHCNGVNDKVIGYMIYYLFPSHIRILKVAVDPDVQRRGVGRLLVKKMISKLSSHRRSHLVIDVRERNLAAQLFFRRMGFRAIAVNDGVFLDGDDENGTAYVMHYSLNGEALPENYELEQQDRSFIE